MKLLITGSREWTDRKAIRDVLARFPAGTVLIHGACRGADKIAAGVGNQLGFDVRPYPADWERFGNAAGPIRNQEMIDKECLDGDEIDICIAFHDDLENSKGTKDMIEKADNAGINTRRYYSRAAQPVPAVKVKTSASGRRYVEIDEVIKRRLARAR